jgi:hypothetical protein
MRPEKAAAPSSERNGGESPASRLGGGQTRRLDRLTLGGRQEYRTLRLRCVLPPSTSEPARLAAVSRLSDALGKWMCQFDTLQKGAATLRREVGVRKGRMTATVVVQHAAAWTAIGGQICDGLLSLPPPYNGVVAASWEDVQAEIHVRVVGVPPFMSPDQMRDVLQRQGIPPRVCEHEPGRHGLRRNEAFRVVFPPETKRPLPKGVELTDVGAKLRYDVIPGVPIPQLPPETPEEDPMAAGASPGGVMPGTRVQPPAGEVSLGAGLAPAPVTAAMEQLPGPVAVSPAALPLVAPAVTQLQPTLPPQVEVGDAALAVVDGSQPVQRRASASGAPRGGRSGFDFGAAAGVRRSQRVRQQPKRLRAAFEGSPSDGSEGSEDREMPQSHPLLPSGQG